MILAAEGGGVGEGALGDGFPFGGVKPVVLDLVSELGDVAGFDDDGVAGRKDVVHAEAAGDHHTFVESHGHEIDADPGLDLGVGANGENDEAGAGSEVNKEWAIGVVVEEFDVGGDGESGE